MSKFPAFRKWQAKLNGHFSIPRGHRRSCEWQGSAATASTGHSRNIAIFILCSYNTHLSKCITYSDNVILDAATVIDKNETVTIHLSYQSVISAHRGLQLYYYSNVVAVFVLLLGRLFWTL